MKGIVISQLIADSVLDWSHGMRRDIRRLIIPESGNISITLDGDNIYVFRFQNEAQWRKNCKILFEVEVAENLISEAEAFLAAKERLELLKPDLQQIIDAQA